MSAKEKLLELLDNADEEMLTRMQEALIEFYDSKSEEKLPRPPRSSDL